LLEASRNQETSASDATDDADDEPNEPLFIDPYSLDKSHFFEEGYRPTIVAVIKEILKERNGIFLNELASEVRKKSG